MEYVRSILVMQQRWARRSSYDRGFHGPRFSLRKFEASKPELLLLRLDVPVYEYSVYEWRCEKIMKNN